MASRFVKSLRTETLRRVFGPQSNKNSAIQEGQPILPPPGDEELRGMLAHCGWPEAKNQYILRAAQQRRAK